MDEMELRRAVVEGAGEDGPRLAYAAWCEGQGMAARGAFIRAQVERAKAESGSTEAERWFGEEMKALRARPRGEDWWGLYEGVLARYRERAGKGRTSVSFRDGRGFVAGIGGRAEEVVEVLEDVCAVEPVEEVWLEWDAGQGEGVLERLAGMGVLGRMKAISGSAAPEVVGALGRSRFVGGVAGLSLWRRAGEKGVLEVGRLVEGLGEAVRGGLSGVRRLGMRGVVLGEAGAERLAERVLSRGGWERVAIDEAGLGDEGARVMGGAAGLEGVERLSVQENGITAVGVEALVNAGGLAGVRDLDLSGNVMDGAGMEAVQKRRGMVGLRRLGVKGSVREAVEEEWREWTGQSLGSGVAMREMTVKEVGERWGVGGVVLY